MIKNKKAAMEMSVGTIVTIVLLMAVLVLGLIMVQRIFGSSTNAIGNVDSEIQNQISQIFDDTDSTLIIYPTSRRINLEQDSTDAGFAFAVKNRGTETKTYSSILVAEDASNCGSGFDEEDAESILLGAENGPYNLQSGEDTISNRDIILFTLNENVPLCTIKYRLHICEGYETCTVSRSTESASVFVTVE
jgi:hypothetical protein